MRLLRFARNDRKGFTLIEMIIMIGVASVLMIGMGRAVRSQVESVTRMRNFYVAMNLAKKYMAVMNNAAFPGLGTTDPESAGDKTSFPGFTMSQVVSNVATSGADFNYRIEITVTSANDSRQLVDLNTYRTNTASFGDGS